MDDEAGHQGQEICTGCGKDELRLLAGRVTRMAPQGPANVFQCVSCGHLNWRDVPTQPPGKRT
jgi:hypothetical protein